MVKIDKIINLDSYRTLQQVEGPTGIFMSLFDVTAWLASIAADTEDAHLTKLELKLSFNGYTSSSSGATFLQGNTSVPWFEILFVAYNKTGVSLPVEDLTTSDFFTLVYSAFGKNCVYRRLSDVLTFHQGSDMIYTDNEEPPEVIHQTHFQSDVIKVDWTPTAAESKKIKDNEIDSGEEAIPSYAIVLLMRNDEDARGNFYFSYTGQLRASASLREAASEELIELK
jgi:hypothetical protein